MGWICLIGCCAGSVYASFNYNLFKIVTGALRSLMAPFGIKVPRSTTLEKILR